MTRTRIVSMLSSRVIPFSSHSRSLGGVQTLGRRGRMALFSFHRCQHYYESGQPSGGSRSPSGGPAGRPSRRRPRCEQSHDPAHLVRRGTIVDLELGGKVALVTGGSKGIGRACAESLAAEGCRIAICARGSEALEATARELAGRGATAVTISADLSAEDSAIRVVAEVIRHLGRLDILVNNAGAIRDGGFLETAVSVWEHDWRLKLMGYVRMAQAALPHMRARRWGRI